MTDNWEEEMERRQEARRAALRRCLEHSKSPTGRWFSQAAKAWIEGREAPPPPPRRPAPQTAVTQEDELLADGFVFSVRDARQQEAEGEHRARRRRAEAERASRERLHSFLRDAYGLDYADRFMR